MYTGMFVLVLSLFSCATKPGLSRNPLFILDADHDHKSMVYVGSLPYENCGSMQTMIRLKNDSTYAMESMQSDEIMHTSGTYSWKKGFIILKSSDSVGLIR